MRDAIQREKNLKHWPRAWKTRLIAQDNAAWRDLYEDIATWRQLQGDLSARIVGMAGTSPAMTNDMSYAK